MGDRTALQITIYACPPEQAAAVVHLLAEYNLLGEDDDHLLLGMTHTIEETNLGTAADLANELEQHAPDAAFEVWEDPKYEFLGDLHRHTPELGGFNAECSANGEPIFTDDQVWLMHRLPPDELRAKLGIPWKDALRSYRVTDVHGGSTAWPSFYSAVGVLLEDEDDD